MKQKDMDSVDRHQQRLINKLIKMAGRNVWQDRFQWMAIGFLACGWLLGHLLLK